MKKFLIVAMAILSISSASAQDNVIKVRPGPLFFGSVNLSYERVMPNGSQSFVINTGVLIPRQFPNFIISSAQVPGETAEVANKLSGFSFIPEYRFYTGGSAPEGFYLAPYLKISNYALTLSSTYDGYDAEGRGNYLTLGAGLAIGYQWIIGDHFSIDWTFAGIGVNRNTLGVKFSSTEEGVDYADWENDILTEFGDIPLIGGKLTTEVNTDHVKVKAPFFWPGFRTAFTLGFAF